MRKPVYTKFLPIIVTAAGLAGFLLRLWALGKGPDSEGLYAPAPVPWVLLWILTVAVPVITIILCRPLKDTGKYSENFPPSPIAAIGCLLAALAIMVASLGRLMGNPDLIVFLTGVAGMIAGVLMGVLSFNRLKGRRPNFFCHASACLYFALEIFDQCRQWSNEPQISVFVFPFLAQLCIMLASYQLCAFDVDFGKRLPSLLWSLLAVYLCLIALPGSENILYYGCIAIWLLTNLCSLRPVKKRRPAPTEEQIPSVQAQLSSNDVSIEELNSWLEEEQAGQ